MKKVRKRKWTNLFLCMAMLLIVGCVMHPVKVQAAETDTISISGKVHHDFEEEVFQLVNKERKKEKVDPLKRSKQFQSLSEQRAAEIYVMFSHNRLDGNACFSIIPENVNFYTAGENIAMGQRSPEHVVDTWMNSPGHKSNILNEDFTHIGIGCFEKDGMLCWVQLFYGTDDPVADDWIKKGHGENYRITTPISYDALAMENEIYANYGLKASEKEVKPGEKGNVSAKLYGDERYLGLLSGPNVTATSNAKDVVEVTGNRKWNAKQEGKATLTIKWSGSGLSCKQPFVVKCTHEDQNGDFLCDHCQKPLKPTTPKLKSVANKENGILFTWEASKYARNYNVYRKLPSDKSWTYLETVKETSYLDSDVKNNETYIYTAKAKNKDAKSGYDKKGLQIVRLTTPVLSKAENVTDGVKVTWKKVPGATTYNVYRKANGAKKWTTLVRKVKGTSFIDQDVENNVPYVYTVRGVKNNQLSYYDTKGIEVTHLSVPKVTAKNTVGGVKLTWKAVPGATGYKVYHKAAGEKKWTVLAANHSGTSFQDAKVANGKEYTFAVRALKENERSYYKGVKLVHVSTPALRDAKQVKKGIRVRWEEVKGATSYRVYRKEAGEKSWTTIAKSVEGLSYTDQKVADGHTYIYTVKAFRGKTYSGNSSKGVSCTYEK